MNSESVISELKLNMCINLSPPIGVLMQFWKNKPPNGRAKALIVIERMIFGKRNKNKNRNTLHVKL